MRAGARARTLRRMPSEQPRSDRPTADMPDGPLTRLPVVYAVAIALQRAGVPMAAMAEQLEIPAESMPALLEVAAAKLAVLSRQAVGETGAASTRDDERNPRG
jgi:hypothetical protein